ncbi:MAG TPA: S41 family peptidase [Myxococcota bacterium]|nr:S41 family peptidase [Myxococcota bacterium]HRY93893.1 S41 family peptidase [Myxococcota bacterium]
MLNARAGWTIGLALLGLLVDPAARAAEGLPTLREVLRHFEVAYVDTANPAALALGALQGLARVAPACRAELLPPPGLARLICGEARHDIPLAALADSKELARELEACAAQALAAQAGLTRIKLERAMLRELVARCGDHWSVFLEEELVPRLVDDGSTPAASAGLLFEPSPSGLLVLDVVEGMPAARAGILRGQRVEALGGRPAALLNELEALALVRGKPGEKVEAVVAGKTYTLELAEEPKRHLSVSELGQGLARVHLSDFRQQTGQRLAGVLEKLEAGGGLKGLVLDLRGNPGGLVTEGTAVAGLFLPAGPVVSVAGKEHQRIQVERNPQGGLWQQLPLVVLVDHRSASVSEIVVMALRDARRAKLVGETTLGKGTVQDVLELSEGSALKLSTGRYYSPAGTPNYDGIEPDVSVAWDGRGEDVQLKRALALLGK